MKKNEKKKNTNEYIQWHERCNGDNKNVRTTRQAHIVKVGLSS